MYERFYQLRERPFALSPDPDYLYPSRVHREALDYLRFGIEGDAGFVVITGEIGSGKTTLLQVLLRSLDGQTTVMRLVNTLLTGPELLESMLLDLGVSRSATDQAADAARAGAAARRAARAGRRVVAVIDEAQNLSLEALEELRMLSNLETEKSKLIQIVLVGQPDLRDTLERPSLEQLRQRVTVRYHIDPLDADETARYINHRLARAATAAPLSFRATSTDRGPRAQRRRAADDQRHLRRACCSAATPRNRAPSTCRSCAGDRGAGSRRTSCGRNGRARHACGHAARRAPAVEHSAPAVREAPYAAAQHTVPVARGCERRCGRRVRLRPPDMRLRQPSAAPDVPGRPRLVQTPAAAAAADVQRPQTAHWRRPRRASPLACSSATGAAAGGVQLMPTARQNGRLELVEDDAARLRPEAERR